MKNSYWLKIGIIFLISLSLLFIGGVRNFLNEISGHNNIDIFLTIASIMGVFFSIFFSIVLVAVQHSASNYLPSILSLFKKDHRLIFIISLATMSIFSSIYLYLTASYHFIYLSLLMFFLSFFSIILYFYEMLSFFNPSFLVANLEKEIISKMKEIKKRTLKRVEKNIGRTFLERILPFIQEAELNSDEYSKKNIEEIEKLFNHVERSNAINDPETYKKSLNSVSNVVEYYLSNKKVDSQNDVFISHTLTKLSLQADFLLKRNEHFKVIEIINTFEKIAISSLRNLKVLHFLGINYMASLACHYVAEIGEKSIKIKNLDLTRDAIISLEKVGFVSIEKNLSTTMTEVKIKELALKANNWFIYNSALNSIGKILSYLIENTPKKENIKKVLPEGDAARLIEYHADLLKQAIIGFGGYLEGSGAVSPVFGFLSDVRLSKIINKILWLSKNPPVELATHNYETMAKSFIEDIFENQKEFIKEAKDRGANIVLIDCIKEFLEVFKILSETNLVTYKEGFKHELDLLKKLILACYKNRHTLNLLKNSIEEKISELMEDKKTNKKVIRELTNILKTLKKSEPKT